MSSWRLHASYSYLRMNLSLDSGSLANPGLPATNEGLAPRHQFVLLSAMDLPHDFELAATLRHVDDSRTLIFSAYTTLDLGLAWHPPGRWEIALAGQNLLDSPHF